MNAMNIFSQNLKYLLLEKGFSRSEWVQVLASSLRCVQKRARALLDGETTELNQAELEALTRFSRIDPEKVLSENLMKIDNVEIFSRNLSFLLDSLPHGKKKHLAKKLGVDQTTISRWGNGMQRPTKKKITAILDYFNLPKTTDLEKETLFLSTMPIGEGETKKWLKNKIDELGSETLRELTPALIMLLKGK